LVTIFERMKIREQMSKTTRRLGRREFTAASFGGVLMPSTAAPSGPGSAGDSRRPVGPPTQRARFSRVFPGVFKLTFGTPEAHTPVKLRRRGPALGGLKSLPPVSECPIAVAAVRGRQVRRGYVVTLPLGAGEILYGLGLQLMSLMQRGTKKTLRVNADPRHDAGDSHAPVPFYVSTQGYGVLVDTARYITFYMGGRTRRGESAGKLSVETTSTPAAQNLPQAYFRRRFGESSEVIIDVPHASGLDIYVFAGPSMREAVQRYNLFSGGGCLPSLAGLGMLYHTDSSFNQDQVLAIAADIRASGIPCDSIGLEPGWQSHGYSCSFTWSDKFPDPEQMAAKLSVNGMELNAWEHSFTHPSSPIHKVLEPYSAEFEVWNGLVPDFALAEARKIYNDFHAKEHAARGIRGYKLDECDNSDYTGGWSFPECSEFPSGMDGEQAHCLYGVLYQSTIEDMFVQQNIRTYSLARSSGALAAPYPFVLYSDLYDHRVFIRGVVNAGFSGLLWTPEVRDAASEEDLLRRIQSMIFSPFVLVNAWYIKHPPWKQVRTEENNAGRFAAGWRETARKCRELFELRMRFIPYIYSAFFRYRETGLPPFRGLVMDWPEDPQCWSIDDQWMMGDSILVAPVVAGQNKRKVYLPSGVWYDFWTGEKRTGHQWVAVDVPLERVPVFVKDGTLLPLAQATLHTGDPQARDIEVSVYGDGSQGAMLIEDDGKTCNVFKGEYNRVTLRYDPVRRIGLVNRSGTSKVQGYNIRDWREIGSR